MRNFAPSLAFAFLVSGCTLLSMKPPVIASKQIQIDKADLQSLSLRMILGIDNPNDTDLPLENLDAQLSIDDSPFLEKKWEQLPVLKQKARTQVELPFDVGWDKMLKAALKFATDHRLPYRLKGSVKLKGFTLPFEQSGEFAMDEVKQSH